MFHDCYHIHDRIPEFKLFVGGRWTATRGRRTLDADSPIDDAVIARVQAGTAADAERAVAAAYGARKPIRARA